MEIHDIVRYLHNVRKKDGSANPIIGEDELGVVAILSYLLAVSYTHLTLPTICSV